MKWEQNDHDDCRVSEYSDIIHKRDFGTLKDRLGILIFLDDQYEVKDIEKVDSGRVTVSIAKQILGALNYSFTFVKILYTNNTSDACSLTNDLLKKYNLKKK
jgi:hypothetical protein